MYLLISLLYETVLYQNHYLKAPETQGSHFLQSKIALEKNTDSDEDSDTAEDIDDRKNI